MPGAPTSRTARLAVSSPGGQRQFEKTKPISRLRRFHAPPICPPNCRTKPILWSSPSPAQRNGDLTKQTQFVPQPIHLTNLTPTPGQPVTPGSRTKPILRTHSSNPSAMHPQFGKTKPISDPASPEIPNEANSQSTTHPALLLTEKQTQSVRTQQNEPNPPAIPGNLKNKPNLPSGPVLVTPSPNCRTKPIHGPFNGLPPCVAAPLENKIPFMPFIPAKQYRLPAPPATPKLPNEANFPRRPAQHSPAAPAPIRRRIRRYLTPLLGRTD